jgi:hypothetical protein
VGYDLFVIALIVLSIVAAILFVVARDRLRRRDEGDVSSVWSDYARERGLTFVPPEGEWPNRSVPRLSGNDGDLQVVLVREGEEVVTRMELRPKESLLGRMHVTTADTAGAPNLPRVVLEETVLDPALSVFSKPPQLAETVVTSDVARALSGFRMGGDLSFEYERGRIVLEWKGGERNGARLDEARRVVELIDRAMSAAFVRPTSP